MCFQSNLYMKKFSSKDAYSYQYTEKVIAKCKYGLIYVRYKEYAYCFQYNGNMD